MDEKMKAIYIVSIIALLSAMMVMPAAATTWDVYEGQSIQAVLNNVSDGDTVHVHAGTYVLPKSAQEWQISVNTPNITLKGEGADVVTLDGDGNRLIIFLGPTGYGYSGAAPGCIVEGFRIVNSDTGVAVNDNSPNCIIRNNVFEALKAPFGTSAPNTTIMGNVMTYEDYIMMEATNTTFMNNVILNVSNAIASIYVYQTCHNLTLFNNTILNSKSVYGAIVLQDSSMHNISNNIIKGTTGAGILLYKSTANNAITKNNISSNGKGVWLYECTGSDNKIYLNDFVDNTDGNVVVTSTTTTNIWNSTEPIGYTYNGTTYTNYLGNYWSDYGGVDTSPHDGVGDTAYDIAGNDNDYRPLIDKFENYHVKAPAPPTPLTPQTPFLISGEVSYEDGTPILNPVVTVKKTGEDFTVNTSASSNLYLTLTDSTHVSVGDGIIVNASDGTVYNETEHNVTEEDMYEGGFEQDMLLEVGEMPDLTVTEKSEELLEDGNFTVNYTVANIGDENASASNTTIYIDGVSTLEDPVPALSVDENYTNTVGSFNCPCGTNVTVRVCADSGNVIEESNETNNCLENEFECLPCKPDLTVTAITMPARLRADVINPIGAVIENIGSEDATSFNVTLEADGTAVDTVTVTVTSLNVTENTTVKFLWTPTATGNCTLNVTADATGEIDESDETNNSLTKDVTVLEKLTVTANVRIEGKNDTVWTGAVTFSNSTVTTTDGVTHYLNEPTALGALDEANKSGGFGYVLVDYGWGLYVQEVAGEPPIGWDGWMYRVNYNSPWVGAADFVLNVTTPPAAPHEDVLWYFGAWTAPPLMIELDKTVVNVNENVIATVTGYNDTAAMFEPVENATVHADGLTFQTGPDGNATLSIETAGNYIVYADKGTWADYTRSEKKAVTVLSVESYGESVYYKKNVRLAWRALDEPDNKGAILTRKARIAIELEETIPGCKNVSVWVRKLGVRKVKFDVYVSSDGTDWTKIGSETCKFGWWKRYDFSGEFGDVQYIAIKKQGTWWKPRIMGLDAVYAKN